MPYLGRRWMEGRHNARILYRGVVQQGYSGSERHIQKAVQPWRNGTCRPAKLSPPSKWLVLRSYRGLNTSEKNMLAPFLQSNPLLAQRHQLKEWFHDIVLQGDLEALDAWSHEAARSGLTPFQGVARSFRQDYEAIKLALTTPWSTDQCEGQIC